MKIINKLFLSLLPVITFAQSVISGKILDDNNVPIPFCNVLLLNSTDDINFGGCTSDENGNFEISTSSLGAFKIKISSIGFEKYTSDIFLISQEGQSIELNILRLKGEAYALSNISLTGKKSPIQKKLIEL